MVSTFVPTLEVESGNERRRLSARRYAFLALVVLTWFGMVGFMSAVLGRGGLTWVEAAMVLCFAMTVPWIAIGFWNALIGLFLLKFARDPLKAVCPFVAGGGEDEPIWARTAIVMPVFNESPQRVFQHLDAISRSLESGPWSEQFEFFVLSDTQDPELAAREERAFNAWRRRHPAPERLHYRRRSENRGYKAGNLREFCDTHGPDYDFMVVLDADSLMSGEAIVRLARLMQRNPRFGILQSLAVGLPSDSAFARIFQFGMRQGMRSYTYGSAWWQGDRGPYWGHNAILRLEPFRLYCDLPRLPGGPPLGGDVLSHDQVEAVLMRRAGYEVRVLPVEEGSYEENPPTLPDFIQRDLRWCQGNMQYFRLLGLPGIGALGRVQLGLAILMYLGAPFWIGFLLLSFSQVIFESFGLASGTAVTFWGELGAGVGLGLFIAMMGMTFTPRVMGLLDVITSARKRRAYGGGWRAFGAGLVEIVFSMLLAPVIAVAQSIFIVGLFLGRQITWNGQNRDGHAISFAEAWRGLWPQFSMGVAATAVFVALMPSVLPFAAPLLLGLLLAIPLTVATSNPRLGRFLADWRVCSVPEEWAPPAVFGFLEPVPTQSQPAPGGVEFVPEEAVAAPIREP